MYSMRGTAPNGVRYTFAYQDIPDYMEGDEWADVVAEIRRGNAEAEREAIRKAMSTATCPECGTLERFGHQGSCSILARLEAET